ncbi:MAG: hypothetical protein ABH951_00500 [Patescibacteria group bacterium]
MSKNLIKDMVKVKKNNVKTLSQSKSQNPEEIKIRTDIDAKFDSLYNFSKKNEEDKDTNLPQIHNSGSKYGLWFIALIAMVFLFFAVSFLFSGAKITVIPKVVELTLDDGFVATKESGTDGLLFDLVIISEEETKEVQGGEEKDLNENAKGVAILYNTFGSSSQKLDINTRLEGSNGKIYKTNKATTIPGKKSDGTPGSVEVEIYGSETGQEYNSEPLDFTILGFKGTAKYTKMYARSKGNITGGFKGKARVISETDKVNAVSELKESLKNKLVSKAVDQIPDGYILFEDAMFVETDEGTIGSALEDGMMPLTLKGTFYGFLFDENKLTRRIVANNIEKYTDEDVFIHNIKDLVFSLNNKENISFDDVKEINFNLVGSSNIVWKIDSDKLIGDVLGKDKNDFNQILVQYSSIDSAEVIVKPVWKKTFPNKIKDIKVIINYPE